MTTQTATPEITVTPSQLVTAKTICLALHRGKFGNRKQASMADIEVDADKSLLRMAKQLLDSKELQDIQRLDSEVASYLKRVAFPSQFKGGVYLIPVSMVTDIEGALQNFRTRREALIDVAVQMYPTRVEDTAARLGMVYNPRDYPSTDRFRACFTFDWQYVTFETPSRLKAISAQLFETERAKAEARLSAVADECRDAMRSGLATMIDRLVERLTPAEDGKKKVFTSTAVTNINEFLSTFELRNVTDDAELGALVEKARGIMTGIDVKTLRSDDLIRQGVAEKLTTLANALEPMTIDRGTRAISFADED